MTWRELRSLIIEALRASDFDQIMKNTEIMQCRLERAFFLCRKWKGGRDDESILKEKWLTFHDHKWLTFKRPLTRDKATAPTHPHPHLHVKASCFQNLRVVISEKKILFMLAALKAKIARSLPITVVFLVGYLLFVEKNAME